MAEASLCETAMSMALVPQPEVPQSEVTTPRRWVFWLIMRSVILNSQCPWPSELMGFYHVSSTDVFYSAEDWHQILGTKPHVSICDWWGSVVWLWWQEKLELEGEVKFKAFIQELIQICIHLCAFFQIDWVKKNQFAGIMIWALDFDDFTGGFCYEGGNYPLLRHMNKELLGFAPTSPPG